MPAYPRYVPRAVAGEIEEARRRLPRYLPQVAVAEVDPRAVLARKYPRGPVIADPRAALARRYPRGPVRAAASVPIAADPDVRPRFMSRDPEGVFEESAADVGNTTARVERSPSDLAADRYRTLSTKPITDENGRLKSGGYGAAAGLSAARGSNSLGYTLGSALGGFLGGVVLPKSDEARGRPGELAKAKEAMAVESAIERAKLDRDQQVAQTRQTNANAKYTEEIKPLEAQQRAAQRERTAVMANLRTLKGQQLDPANPRHATFLSRAETAGIFIDPDEWNNSGGNLVSVTEVDPENPTQTRTKMYNKVTGSLEDLGQRGYVQPVRASGMTEAQERGDADRDASRADTNSRFQASFGLGVDKFQESMRRGLSADAARTFGVEVRGQFERGRGIEKEIADITRLKGENKIGIEAGNKRIEALKAEAAQLADGITSARSKALGAAATRPAAPTRRAPAAAARRPAAAPSISEETIRARAVEAGLDPNIAVQRARARGVLR